MLGAVALCRQDRQGPGRMRQQGQSARIGLPRSEQNSERQEDGACAASTVLRAETAFAVSVVVSDSQQRNGSSEVAAYRRLQNTAAGASTGPDRDNTLRHNGAITAHDGVW